MFLTLPYSGIEVDLPLIGYFFDGAPDAGLEPDLRIVPTVEDVRRNRDATL